MTKSEKNRTRQKKSKSAIAYHEAGHVVVGWHLGVRMRHATILPTLDADGHVVQENDPLRGIQLDFDGSDRARIKAEKLVQMLLAGHEAQKRYSRRSTFSASDDHQRAVDLAMYFNGSTETTEAHLHWLGLGVRDLVEAKWDEITKIAEALQEHGSLDRKAIRTIMHPPPVPSGKGANSLRSPRLPGRVQAARLGG